MAEVHGHDRPEAPKPKRERRAMKLLAFESPIPAGLMRWLTTEANANERGVPSQVVFVLKQAWREALDTHEKLTALRTRRLVCDHDIELSMACLACGRGKDGGKDG